MYQLEHILNVLSFPIFPRNKIWLKNKIPQFLIKNTAETSYTPPIIGKLYVIKVYLPSRRKKDLFLYKGSVADIVWTTKESFPEYI